MFFEFLRNEYDIDIVKRCKQVPWTCYLEAFL